MRPIATQERDVLAAILGGLVALFVGPDESSPAIDTVLRAHGCSVGRAAELRYDDGSRVIVASSGRARGVA
jgi:hypothetical protein